MYSALIVSLAYELPLVPAFRCGKTSVCQLLSRVLGKTLLTINCHMHTEASDFLGGLRPIRRGSEEVHSCV